MLRLAAFFIQLLLWVSFLVLMNLSLVCFNAVLFSIDGATSARLLAVVRSLYLLFRSAFQYGLSSFSHLLGYIPLLPEKHNCESLL